MCSFISATSITINHLIALTVHTHTQTWFKCRKTPGVSVKFPWQQIIQSIGMKSQCEIPAARGGLLLLNSHCLFERQAEPVSQPASLGST